MKTLNIFLRIIILITLSNSALFSQLELSTYTNKDNYDYGETIELFCKVTNISDTTFEFFAPTYQSCQAEFSFNDFNSWEYTACLATTELLTFQPHASKIYSWRIEPISFGLPNKDGTQTIIGKYFFDLADTIFIQAPKFIGGEIRLTFYGNYLDSVQSISNQLNANIVHGDHFGEIKSQVWQIEGYDIDSLIQIYSNDSIFITFEKSIGIMYENIVDENPLDYYPLNIGDKWYYDVTYDPVWVVGSKTYYLTREVMGDSTYKNGKRYIEIKETRSDTNSINYYYERIDTMNSKVYRYKDNVNEGNEFIFADLILNKNEYFKTFTKYNLYYSEDSLFLKDYKYEEIFENSPSRLVKTYQNLSENYHDYLNTKYAQGIGRIQEFKSVFEAYDEGYQLAAAYINGRFFGDTTLVNVSKNSGSKIYSQFYLSQNYPNPFNPTTTIEYTVPSSSVMLNSFQHLNDSEIPNQVRDDNTNVTLKVYDVLGREVKTLVNQHQKHGKYSVQFEATNLPSGIYYYRLSAGKFSETKKLILLK